MTTVDVSTNGNLNFSGYTGYGNTSFPTGRALIAPLWDDQYIFQGSGQSITEKVSPGNYYAVTWNVSEYAHATDLFTFQAVWFGASTTIGSFQFHPDDIVFSNSTLTADFWGGDATVGLDKGTGGVFTSLPGESDGLITHSQANLLPTGPGDAILFRPDGSGGYTASVIQVFVIQANLVPEPASLVMVGTGTVGLACCVRRRRPKASDRCAWGAP
jgi:hypothetical protein